MKLGAVILAAGAGTRLGGVAKALLPYRDRTFLEQIDHTLRAAGTTDEAREVIVVVAAPFATPVAAAARALGMRVVENPEPERGMASSIARGFAALVASDAAWLWPVDHPAVRVDTLQALVAGLGKPGERDVARPTYEGRGGHPPLVARSLYAKLAACDRDPDGARGVIAMANVANIPVDDRGVIADVDTPEAARSVS